MRAKFSLMLNVFVFIAGLLFVILYFNGKGVFELVSIILGIMFIMTSCLSLIAVFSKELVHKSKWSIVPIVGGMLLGIALVAANEFFARFLAFVFATLLVVGGLYKMWGLFVARKIIVYPKWFYVVPLLIMICGIVFFAIGIDSAQKILSLVVGIAFMAYAINSLCEYIVYKEAFRKQAEVKRDSEAIAIREE